MSEKASWPELEHADQPLHPGLCFPNRPLAPVKDAVFDDQELQK